MNENPLREEKIVRSEDKMTRLGRRVAYALVIAVTVVALLGLALVAALLLRAIINLGA